MSNYLLYKPLKYLRKMFSFEQNMVKTLGGCFFAPPCIVDGRNKLLRPAVIYIQNFKLYYDYHECMNCNLLE